MLKTVSIIHIWEDDWNIKRDVIENRIRNILVEPKHKIGARECTVKEILNKRSKEFLEKNHLQGNVNAKVKLGLFYDKKLVSVMTFGKRNKIKEYEILRYSAENDYIIMGGFMKLFKHFIETYSPKNVTTYADLDWTFYRNNVYERNGFEFFGTTEPGYYWIVKGMRESRQKYTKKKLIEMGEDPNKTADEIMHDKGFYKIYNSGNLHYQWKKEKGT